MSADTAIPAISLRLPTAGALHGRSLRPSILGRGQHRPQRGREFFVATNTVPYSAGNQAHGGGRSSSVVLPAVEGLVRWIRYFPGSA